MLCLCHFIFGAAKITILIPHFVVLRVQRISLTEFKNHHDLQLTLDSDVIAISGLNGVGKTTVLDAIHFLCIGKSYFSSSDVQCLQHDASIGGIKAYIEDDELYEVIVRLKRGGKKSIELNGKPHKRVMDHIGRFFAVVIAPGDIELIYGGNTVRRNWINQVLSQVSADHLYELVAYNKLLENRNRHLKEERVDLDLLFSIDQQMGPLAHSIHHARKDFLAKFSKRFEAFYNQLSGKKESIRLNYTSQLDTKAYGDWVVSNRAKDLAVHRSFSGIHRDEMEMELEGVHIRKYGSQGQMKSALIALKLAEYEFLSHAVEKLPFLLLDDIFEKIDDERAEVLTKIIKSGTFGQIFITDTHVERIEQFSHAIGREYKSVRL